MNDCDLALKYMKEALTPSPVLGFPDFQSEFILETDASFDMIGTDNNDYDIVIANGSHAIYNHDK